MKFKVNRNNKVLVFEIENIYQIVLKGGTKIYLVGERERELVEREIMNSKSSFIKVKNHTFNKNYIIAIEPALQIQQKIAEEIQYTGEVKTTGLIGIAKKAVKQLPTLPPPPKWSKFSQQPKNPLN